VRCDRDPSGVEPLEGFGGVMEPNCSGSGGRTPMRCELGVAACLATMTSPDLGLSTTITGAGAGAGAEGQLH
jgi:hypothetical protein